MDLATALLTPGVGVVTLAFAAGMLLGAWILDVQFRAHARTAEEWSARSRMHMRAYQRIANTGSDSPLCRRLKLMEYDAAVDCARRATAFREMIPHALRHRYLH